MRKCELPHIWEVVEVSERFQKMKTMKSRSNALKLLVVLGERCHPFFFRIKASCGEFPVKIRLPPNICKDVEVPESFHKMKNMKSRCNVHKMLAILVE